MEIYQGLVVGYVTVKKVHRLSGMGASWECECVCGKHLVIKGKILRSEPTINCGCQTGRMLSEARTKHGHAKDNKFSGGYKSYNAMKYRCLNPEHNEYSNYGGRGIKICARWLGGYHNFYEDMGDRPAGFTLDRKDVDGDYNPANCRWAARKDQDRNKRNTVWVEWNGAQVQLRALAEQFNLPRSRVYQQWKRGYALEVIFSECNL